MTPREHQLYVAAERIRPQMRDVDPYCQWGIYVASTPILGQPAQFGGGLIFDAGRPSHFCREDFHSADEAADWVLRIGRRELEKHRRGPILRWLAAAWHWASGRAARAALAEHDGREG
ncbi:hypothetical protein V5F34_00780 [Xanthobacter autotrophicus]|uniref:hypothetical protein n=1 Tax=Xanthobacter autotrophicus TaxID=280 RepID=UPI0037279C82